MDAPDSNPYATPAATEASRRELALERWSKRPVGVTLIAGMLLLRGSMTLVKLGALLLFFPSTTIEIELLSELAQFNRGLLLTEGISAALGIVVAVGALRGAAWSWSLGMTAAVAKLVISVGIILFLDRDAHSMSVGEHLVRWTATIVAMLYAMRSNVFEFASIAPRKRAIRALTAFVVGCTIGGLVLSQSKLS